VTSSRTRVAGPGLVVGRRRRRPSRLDRPPGRTYPLKWVVVALAIAALVLFGGPWLFIYLFEGSTPGRLTLPSASGVPKGPLQPGPISGTWVISAGSVVGYRVPEVLFGTSHTAVGRTDQVSGGMVVSGTEVTAADFTVEVATIHSDQAARDYQFRNGIMDTADHPHASFHLTAPIQLGTIPPVGRIVTFPAQGDLSLRGVTRAIDFQLSAERLSATSIDINAEIPISFPEWHIPNPSLAAGYVAQVADHGTLEVLLHLTPAPPPAAH
jgi:polyisoprenoid-binding protein YceI